MRKITLTALALISSLALVACNDNEGKDTDKAVKPEPKVEALKAELTVPKTAEVGDKVEFQVKVTQGEKIITDASEVMFEVENDDTNTDKMLETKINKDNVYVAEMTIKEAGEYEITAHVTNGEEHEMVDANMNVAGSTAKTEKHDDSEEAHEHKHAHGDTSVTFSQTTAKKGESTKFGVTIQHDGAALSDAKVRFQIVNEGTGEAGWLTLKEKTDGTYEENHTFNDAGTYKVTLHVEKGKELHYHEEKTFTVK
ncbi:FixH family protein [Viridibacillus sp. YIM B01967]|uniref:FixH family protein n=1 Tax=Viridibacillus soli TaxID=2798301 RepID=A0ABS1HDA9_9BACL|nr:FixH family protein [Viridibacillus soli]MBK3497366.1 FixH family protein [Viridibacillus soli]